VVIEYDLKHHSTKMMRSLECHQTKKCSHAVFIVFEDLLLFSFLFVICLL